MPDHLPDWPRVLTEDMAAAYVSLSLNSFRRHVDVKPIWLTPGRKGWVREDLDAWVNRKRGLAPDGDINWATA